MMMSLKKNFLNYEFSKIDQDILNKKKFKNLKNNTLNFLKFFKI
jgi:hypothetical protein